MAGRLRVLAQLLHEAVGRKRQRRAARLQLAVVPAFMQKASGQPKGRLVELQRGRKRRGRRGWCSRVAW